MRLLIVLALLLCATVVVGGSCNYNNNMVCETGYACRPMTESEKNQMIVYGQQWDQWGRQFERYMKGRDTMPTTPIMPCFCHSCNF